jgi:hypothetical protein
VQQRIAISNNTGIEFINAATALKIGVTYSDAPKLASRIVALSATEFALTLDSEPKCVLVYRRVRPSPVAPRVTKLKLSSDVTAIHSSLATRGDLLVATKDGSVRRFDGKTLQCLDVYRVPPRSGYCILLASNEPQRLIACLYSIGYVHMLT